MPDPDCPVCRTAEIVCGKWTLLIVRDLAEGRSRFCELERSLGGISPRTLSLRLRALEEEGIVHRAHVPRGPAARRVRADREGPRARADHRLDAHLRQRVARRDGLAAPRRPSRRRVEPSARVDPAARAFRPAAAAAMRGAPGRRASACGESAAHAQPGAARLPRRLRRGGRRGSSPRRSPAAPRSRSSSTRARRPGARAAVLLPPADRALHRPAHRLLARLPSYPAAAQGLEPGCPTCPATCAPMGRRARGRRPARAGRRRAAGVPRRAVGGGDRLRLRRRALRAPRTPSSRRRSTPAARCRSCSPPVDGLVIESDEVPLGDGLSARPRRHARARAGRAHRRPARHRGRARAGDRGRRRARARAGRPPAAPAADRAAAVGRRRARARPDRLGAHRRQRVDGVPLATGLRRAAGDCLLHGRGGGPAARVLRLVARRTPRAGELAWALRRFELGCERGGAVEALTDWLLCRPRAARRHRLARLRRRAPSGSRRSAPRCRDRERARAARARGDLARARRDGRLRAPDDRRSRRSSPSSAAACAPCCATCSAATSTRACAGSPTSC